MPNIYFKPHSKRKYEQDFFNYLARSIGNSNQIEENYKLPNNLIERLIDRDKVISFVNSSEYITENKHVIMLQYLSDLPNKIMVASNIKSVSVDFAIEDQGKLTLIEFHEKQHSGLTVSRLQPVFTPEGKSIPVPRFLQRLIKDIWRWENLTNYKIVWADWFEKNRSNPIKFRSAGNEEFALPNKFSISKTDKLKC